MALTRFDPPGFVDDLGAPQRQLWSDWVSRQLDEARERVTSGLINDGPRHQFFNPLRNPPDADAVERDIQWRAFPKLVETRSVSDIQRWQTADGSRDVQDEYCEWSVDRDPNTNKIVRVTFTSEAPEYWAFLASQDPEKLLSLYRAHTSPNVQMADLFDSQGAYRPRNHWNNSTQGGAMHLIQDNNTLGAEIELAAAATIVRLRDGQPLTSEPDLIACGKYGQAGRNSDPHIGAQVNALARARDEVSLANPVGLCIAGLDTLPFETPDGSPAAACWTITRGTPEKALRAVFEVPEAKGFVVGDLKINGTKIRFGAQIADFITIKLTGIATRLGKSIVAPVEGCVTPSGVTTKAASVAAALHAELGSRRG